MGHQDAELIRRWQRGDAAAFEALVHRWEQPVLRLLARYAGSRVSIHDLAQEVFLRVYQAGPRYRERGAFSTWLYRIALNVARDALRRRQPLPLADHDLETNSVPAETHWEQRELAGAVARALAELPDPLREVLVLRHYEDLNFEEIARLTGTPASTLKSRFTVALQRLRARLQEMGWGDEE